MNPEIITSFDGTRVRRFKTSRTVLALVGDLAGAMGDLTKLLSMKGGQLKDKSLMDSDDKQAAKITETVQNKQSKELFAVIEGPQGWRVLPVSELETSNQGNVKCSRNKDQSRQAQSYEKTQYRPIAFVQPLSKFSAAN